MVVTTSRSDVSTERRDHLGAIYDLVEAQIVPAFDTEAAPSSHEETKDTKDTKNTFQRPVLLTAKCLRRNVFVPFVFFASFV